MQDDFRRQILQHEGHRKAALETDPVRRGLDIRQQLALRLLPADRERNALNLRTMYMPGVSVEPDAGVMTDRHMREPTVLVIGVNPRGSSVEQTEERSVF